jgi:hypothetical protein
MCVCVCVFVCWETKIVLVDLLEGTMEDQKENVKEWKILKQPIYMLI